MTSKFIDGLTKESRKTKTANGATAFKNTKDALVDLFAVIGAMRGQDPSRLHVLIDGAYAESPILLAKMLFQTRDIRGGLGERETFKESIHYCARRYPNVIEPNIALIPEYGRWDDMFALMRTELEKPMFKIMREQLDIDLALVKEGKRPETLLAKWLPTADASSENTKAFAKEVAKGLGFNGVRAYKEAYKPVRKALHTVEAQMSAGEWSEINYESVPSRAMLVHRQAFYTHDEERMTEYINAVTAGKKKINASTLFPYDIVEKVLYRHETGAELDALWGALPDYVQGGKNYLVMADVSGSMSGRPMATSIGLAIYFAQHNQGPYHNAFMTFSGSPEIYNLRGLQGIVDAVRTMSMAEWGMNTDLEKAMMKILAVSVENKCKQEDLPEALIIITDMEFDRATGRQDISFLKNMKDKFKLYGYKMPNVVFWNVNSMKDTYHASADKEGVTMVSGQSTATFKTLMAGLNGKTAYDLMCETLNTERYAPIRVA